MGGYPALLQPNVIINETKPKRNILFSIEDINSQIFEIFHINFLYMFQVN